MIYGHRSAPLISTKESAQRLTRTGVIAFALVTIRRFIGTIGYHFFRKLRCPDSLLNSSMIFAGMSPADKMECDTEKLFAAKNSLFTGIAIPATIRIVSSPILHRSLYNTVHLKGDDKL